MKKELKRNPRIAEGLMAEVPHNKEKYNVLCLNINKSQPSFHAENDKQLMMVCPAWTTFLEVVTGCKLMSKDHISHISGNIALGLGTKIKENKRFIETTLLSLHYSSMYPYYIYCNHIRRCTAKTFVKPLVL